jgi:hypothetical protein
MPPEFHDPSHVWHDDPWARYRKAGIEWIGPLTRQGGVLESPDDLGH